MMLVIETIYKVNILMNKFDDKKKNRQFNDNDKSG